MWQHKWALWSGCLGATASCIGKIAFTDNPMSPLYTLKKDVCQVYLKSDVDAILLDKVYWILGDLMIKYEINLMTYWQTIRLKMEDAVLQLGIFEVDWCQALLLAPRIACFVLMLIVNAYMIASFLKGMKDSGSVVGTALSSGANFVFSALYGYILWGERFSQTWWMGFATVMAGVFLLTTTVATTDSPQRRRKASGLDKKKRPSPVTTTIYERNEKDEFVPKKLPLNEYIKAVGPKSPPATPPRVALTPSKILGPSRKLLKKHKQMTTPFIDRFFMNECPLCQKPLFDDKTGLSATALANLSPQCSTAYHAKCLIQHCAQMKKAKQEALCVVSHKPISLWTRSKQAASLGAFWMERVEGILQQLGPAQDEDGDRPISMTAVRQKLHEDPTLTDQQKEYIDDDPSGLDKGLASCITWGGSVDYNDCAKGHSDYKKFLVTEGIWQYDARRDEIWFHGWGLHPKKRCDFCQSMMPITFMCDETKGSCEGLAYCSEKCQKSGFKRHKLTREIWKEKGPKFAYVGWQ